MPTTRDLVEARTFSQRRLVTAFVRGTLTGREVEPVRPWPALLAGGAVAVLVIAAAAIAGQAGASW